MEIVFLTMIGGNRKIVGIEVALGRALMARGHRVLYVVCDQLLPLCEVKSAAQEERWTELCGKCYGFGRRVLASTGAQVLLASELIAYAGHERCEADWTEYVESALLKHFKRGLLAAGSKTSERRSLFERAALYSELVGKGIVSRKPDRVIMSHGIYCTWGPAREILNRAGIPTVIYAPGKKKNSIVLNWSHSADSWEMTAEWLQVKDVPLSEEQLEELSESLASRRDHRLDARQYSFAPAVSADTVRRRLKLDERPVFGLFTNVLWDAASTRREIVFHNSVEWVIETLRWFEAQQNRQLVIRVHPAEMVLGTSQPFASIIRETFPILPENVRIVDAGDEVNTWALLELIDVGTVHTSTVGLEIALVGKPCVVVSRTHFRDKGFTIDVSDRGAYFDVLRK